MFVRTIVIYIFWACLLPFYSVSCNKVVESCGPFDDKFRTVDFITDFKHLSVTQNQTLNVQYGILESDTVKFDSLGLAMFPMFELYSLSKEKLNPFSFLSQAFACSPPALHSEEIITQIEILSSTDFNPEYTSGTNLSDLFDIIVLYQASGYHRSSLNEFLDSEPTVPSQMFLLPKTAPETTDPIQFTIKYSQDGQLMNSYVYQTSPIVITN
ncbi:MAG: hypothetical protein ACMZ7B_04720 [Balneola sp.]